MIKSIKAITLLALTAATLVISSCSKNKEEVNISGTITATVNGTPKTFNTNALATSASLSGAKLTSISGTAADGTGISITVSGEPTSGKVYASNAANDDEKPLIEYTTADEDFLNDDSSTSNIATVTVTAVTGHAIGGTFKGDLTAIVIGTGDTKTTSITDGKFSVSLVKN